MGFLGDKFTQTRTYCREHYSNSLRSFSLRMANTRSYKSVESLMAYRTVFDTLVNQ